MPKFVMANRRASTTETMGDRKMKHSMIETIQIGLLRIGNWILDKVIGLIERLTR